MSLIQKGWKATTSLFSKLHRSKNKILKNQVETLYNSISTINTKLNNFIYNNASVHPLINQVNIYLLKFLTITNSIILSCEDFYYCKSNMVSLIRLKLYESFVKILTKYILPNNVKPIKCFDLAKIDNINTDETYYYNPSLMKFFRVFTRSIVKYHSLKISKCLQDGKASQEERLEFVFHQFINGFHMITEQLGGISISCEDLIDTQPCVFHNNSLSESTDCKLVVDKYVKIYLSDIVNTYDAIARDIIAALQLLVPNNVLIIFDFNFLTSQSHNKDKTNGDGKHKVSLSDCPNILSIIKAAKVVGKDVYVINHQHVELDNVIPTRNCLDNMEEFDTLIYLWKANNFTTSPLSKDIKNNVDKANIYKLNKNIEKMKYAVQQIQA